VGALQHVGVGAAVFALVLPAELPDKTLVATIVLATRYRPWPVWWGVAAAFAVQCGVAVALGGALGLLPHRAVHGVVAALFAIGAFVLLRPPTRAEKGEEQVAEAQARPTHSWRRQAFTSFAVLFAAEWGDVSQLATAGLQARYHDPVAVFLGSWTALAAIAALAVVAGRAVVRVVPLRLVKLGAGVAFTALTVVFAVAAIRG
jgi:Ca2+/H+ antiporter, TMEM165/GDT1 family